MGTNDENELCFSNRTNSFLILPNNVSSNGTLIAPQINTTTSNIINSSSLASISNLIQLNSGFNQLDENKRDFDSKTVSATAQASQNFKLSIPTDEFTASLLYLSNNNTQPNSLVSSSQQLDDHHRNEYLQLQGHASDLFQQLNNQQITSKYDEELIEDSASSSSPLNSTISSLSSAADNSSSTNNSSFISAQASSIYKNSTSNINSGIN